MTPFSVAATTAASHPAITASQALTAQAVGHPQQSASVFSYREAAKLTHFRVYDHWEINRRGF